MADRAPPPGAAIVSGGASGIGAAVVDVLRRVGHQVFVFDLGEPRAETDLTVDVREADAVNRAVEEVVSRAGAVGVLVNCAGISAHEPLELMSDDNWNRVISVNVTGSFNCLRAAGRQMIARGGGAIVNVASIAVERGGPWRAGYVTSKAAVVGLTRAAAVEWAPFGVRVNAVSPGYVETPLFAAAARAGRVDVEAILARTPMGSLIQVDEVAAAVAFLASQDAGARRVTGQVLTVDGGYLIDNGGTSRRPSTSKE